jgi:hypothetical protein
MLALEALMTLKQAVHIVENSASHSDRLVSEAIHLILGHHPERTTVEARVNAINAMGVVRAKQHLWEVLEKTKPPTIH